MGAGVAGGLEGEDLVGEGRELVPCPTVADADEVYVGVDEAGEHGLGVVDALVDGRALGGHDGLLGTRGPDGVALEEDGAALDGRAAVAVY